MTLQFLTETESYPELLILPLLKSDNLQDQLQHTANSFGLPPQFVSQDFKADYKEQLVSYCTFGNRPLKLILFGLGATPGFSEIQNAFRSLGFQQKNKLPAVVGVELNHSGFNPTLLPRAVEAIANGLLLSRYNISLYKSDQNGPSPFQSENAGIHFFVPAGATELASHANRGRQAAETQMRIFDLMNAPANKKTPEVLAQWALESASRFNYRATVSDKQNCRTKGLHALLAVNQGSEFEPRLIELEYNGITSGKTGPHIGLAGKGVTFDTGGISLKDSTNMHYMKSDMGGAAAVLGAVELAARLQAPVKISAVIVATENMIDSRSTKPGDVIESFSGKSIEVIDTDAEGRLILADALAYLHQTFQPEVMIDLATLTGSCVRTFGYVCAGLFTNNDTLAAQLSAAGDGCGERMWRLPLWDAYNDDLKSDIADVKNFSGKPTAGAISAAKFLEVFTAKHPAWAHLDIAGTAFGDSEYASQKSATAYGVRLLNEYMASLAGLYNS